MSEVAIIPYREEFKEQVLELVVCAWQPVFEKTIKEVPRFVYDNFWPQGWQARQVAEVSALLADNPRDVWLALQGGSLVGFVAVAICPEDRMGEISIVAVSPDHQRKGIGRRLMDHAEQRIRDSGMSMVMVETVGDSGHEPARKTYEALGYEQWPVARYFRKL